MNFYLTADFINMKTYSQKTAQELKTELETEFNGNIEAIADNYGRSIEFIKASINEDISTYQGYDWSFVRNDSYYGSGYIIDSVDTGGEAFITLSKLKEFIDNLNQYNNDN